MTTIRTDERGRKVIHLHAVVDTVALKSRISEVVPKGSSVAGLLKQSDIYTFTIDYYINEATRLLLRVRAEYELFYQRQHLKYVSDARFSDFNGSVTLPSDLPR